MIFVEMENFQKVYVNEGQIMFLLYELYNTMLLTIL